MLTNKRVLCTGVRNGNKIWELPNDETLHVVAAGHILSTTSSSKTLNVLCDDEVVAL